MKYCWQYKEATSSNITGPVCLRLNSLSLSRVGSLERLLWVQSLDLSHNQLHSIEGKNIYNCQISQHALQFAHLTFTWSLQ